MLPIGVKKPAGNAEEIEKHFGCESSQLIMVDENQRVIEFFGFVFEFRLN